jgi:hypothetical protein
VRDLLDPTKWQQIFDGNAEGLGPSCWRAYQLAAQNDAQVAGRGCVPEGLLGFTVEVETNKSVGESIVPGTEQQKANAIATAVIEPLCTFELPGDDGDEKVLPALTCEGREWDLDADDPALVPKPEDLFDVHLAEPQANDE